MKRPHKEDEPNVTRKKNTAVKLIRLSLLTQYSELTTTIPKTVISIEALRQQPAGKVNAFFSSWLKQWNAHALVDIPISTSKQANRLNFLQLVIMHDQRAVFAALLKDTRTRHLLHTSDHRNFLPEHIAAEYGANKILAFMLHNNISALNKTIKNPEHRLHQGDLTHVAALNGRLATLEWLL